VVFSTVTETTVIVLHHYQELVHGFAKVVDVLNHFGSFGHFSFFSVGDPAAGTLLATLDTRFTQRVFAGLG
jgi:hypothetical protein